MAELKIKSPGRDINLKNITSEDGLELAKQILYNHPEQKIVILSGYDLPVYRNEASQSVNSSKNGIEPLKINFPCMICERKAISISGSVFLKIELSRLFVNFSSNMQIIKSCIKEKCF